MSLLHLLCRFAHRVFGGFSTCCKADKALLASPERRREPQGAPFQVSIEVPVEPGYETTQPPMSISQARSSGTASGTMLSVAKKRRSFSDSFAGSTSAKCGCAERLEIWRA